MDVKIDNEALRALVHFACRALTSDYDESVKRFNAVSAANVALSQPAVNGEPAAVVPVKELSMALLLLTKHKDMCHIFRDEHLELCTVTAALKARLGDNA